MRTFSTESGSIYEVNFNKKQIRRLFGNHPPSPRQGKDGEWKKYKEITRVMRGKEVMVVWDTGEEKGVEVAKSTVLSRVAWQVNPKSLN